MTSVSVYQFGHQCQRPTGRTGSQPVPLGRGARGSDRSTGAGEPGESGDMLSTNNLSDVASETLTGT